MFWNKEKRYWITFHFNGGSKKICPFSFKTGKELIALLTNNNPAWIKFNNEDTCKFILMKNIDWVEFPVELEQTIEENNDR